MNEIIQIKKTLKPGDIVFITIYDGPSGPARIITIEKDGLIVKFDKEKNNNVLFMFTFRK